MRFVRYITIFFAFLLSLSIEAQQEGDTWVIGYYSLGSPEYSIMHLRFGLDPIEIEWHFDETMQTNETTSTICDQNGKALIWTNGMQVFGKHGTYIADTISYGGAKSFYWDYYNTDTYGPLGFFMHSSTLILPVPEFENDYLVLYHTAAIAHELYFQVNQNLQARVRMHPDSTFELMYKDSMMNEYHEWYNGDIIATRHANGRDWWVVTFEENSTRYYSYLLDPKGIALHHEGEVDSIIKTGLGQSVFSPLGNYMARIDAISANEGQFITLLSFDRCRGELTRLSTFHTEAATFPGVAFSSNERFLYADNRLHLWQWDLWSEDIPASQTLIDTFDGFVQPGWFEMRFGPMMQTPDNRIYVVPPAGSSEFMHTIERPDLPGKECRFIQHNVNLTKPNGRSAPNIPNFRLGPLDGSLCDTLGLDNHPVARWRYEENYPGYWYDILFTDMSFYDPQVWHWDFDDGTTSDERSPLHTFNPGLYHVCLTVSNDYASDSSCKWVNILPTFLDPQADKTERDLSIDPNPFSETLVIKSKSGEFRAVHMQLYDIHGRLVFDQPKAPVPVSIYLPDRITPGMYFCRIVEENGEESGFKLVRN